MSLASTYVGKSEKTIRAGRRLARPPPGEEVVITGCAGYYPESDNVYEFRDNLFNKVDMVTDDDRRWKLDHPEIPQRCGKIKQIGKFDASFFGVHYKQAHTMDPMCRMLLERAYEACVDAGVNPKSLRGSNTGVFIGACFSESEKTWFYEKLQVNGFGITGCSRAMLANRLSYWLGVNGPSYTVDSACSSSLYALEHAYKAIRDGHCDTALVGGSNLCLHPYVSLQFARLGVLSPQGSCRSFDNDANGYTRSEAVVMVLLQKSKDARRIYSTIVHAKTNCDGYKEKGITYPSGDMQKQLLMEFYEECEVDPTSLGFVEAHGTGTKVGDPEECTSLDEVFCTGRKIPLPIGSVKSNIGHSEPASGLCSVTKCIIAMETGFLPPNLHYVNPREGIPALASGMLQVVTEKQPWDGGLIGINSFGFGGANCHVLLKSNEKDKIRGGAPNDKMPRLVVAAGRTEEAIRVMLNDVESRPVDAEFVRLLHEIHSAHIPGHIYRGYSLLVAGERTVRSIKYHPGNKRPIWFVFSGMGGQWPTMGRELMVVPVFAAAIDRCRKVLSPKGLDIVSIISKDDPKIFDNILHSFVGIAAIQIGLVDILSTLGIVPDGIVGHSVGELGCAYADGTLTAEQMVLAAYSRGLASIETEFIKGSMAAVGLGYDAAKGICPPELEIACHNGPDSCTVSGPTKDVRNFVVKLEAKGVFAKEVNCSNIAYHSRYIANAGPKLLKYLKEVIPEPKERSAKWISSSIPKNLWSSPLAKYSSAEYHTNNLLSSVLFEEAIRSIPQDAIAIEIAPHGLLQAILRRSLNSKVVNIPLTQRGHPDNTEFLFTAIGKMYENGITPQLANLYPEVKYPVSRGTPMISPLVRWEHLDDWYVTSYKMQEKIKSGERNVNISMADDEMEFYNGHVVDGRNLFPATGYLTLVWESIGLMRGQLYTEVSVVFENVRFLRATNIPKEGSLDFVIMVQKGSGNFEVVEGGSAVVSGRIFVPDDINKESIELPKLVPVVGKDLNEMSSKDIYKELRLRGYNYSGLFRGIVKTDNVGHCGRIHWANNWVAFMDNMLQMNILDKDTRGLFVPVSIEKLTINVKKHMAALQLMGEDSEMDVSTYSEVGIVKSGGIEIRGLKASAITRRKLLGEPVLEKYEFVPHVGQSSPMDLLTALRVCVHLTLENQFGIKVKAIELADSAADPASVILANSLANILGDLPLITPELTILSAPGNPRVVDVIPPVVVEDRKLAGEQNCLLVLASNILTVAREDVLTKAVAVLLPGGAIVAREKLDTKINIHKGLGLEVIADIPTETERIILLKKGVALLNPKVINIVGEKFAWLPAVQEALANEGSGKQKIILVAQQEPLSGIMGFVNCVRREPGGERVRCVFILDNKAPPFSVTNPLYKDQLVKDLAVNVYKDGTWGSYRHLALPTSPKISAPHAFANILTKGDLSTLQWFEGYLGNNMATMDPTTDLVQVYYSALNFRDVMMATGKLAAESLESSIKTRMNMECIQGFEFSGRSKDGRRVMGMVPFGALTNMLVADKNLLWEVPEDWTLEDAATVPVVYGTAYYALVMSGRMQAGDTVLIHAGSGGVGQAAIQIALHMGCTVFTTVGTPEKRAFIKKQYPQVSESHIGNSRDCSFEQMVMMETNGRGVDLVLNSLAEEKLQASVRCLARGGRFLEIGKFDLSNNNPLGMEVFLRETSFHGIMLDNLFFAEPESKVEIYEVIRKGIQERAIKPLTRTVFKDDEVEKAFRYMAAGKHIGKVLISIRPEEREKRLVPSVKPIIASPRFYCNPTLTYIIAGGLGGFGLELADWLVMRRACKIVLTSRTGFKSGYQASRVRLWRGYGVDIRISTADITTESGVTMLLREAHKVGPVGGIFNLAVVLQDAFLENQTTETFALSAGPKAVATHLLDRLSRKMCPALQHFVVFSSVSCGRGNAGQTNYGFSNSVMERICETRVRDGLHGLAIQWGAVGEVGLVADMQEEQLELVIGGTLQQRIMSCLEVMDGFMRQSSPVVASMVVAEKRSTVSGIGNMVDCVTNIIGIRDLKTVSMHSTLAELGMDSMMAVEIKQTLEREFEMFLTAQDIRSMTFARLAELAESADTEDPVSVPVGNLVEHHVEGMGLMMRVVGDEISSSMPVIILPSMCSTGDEVEDIASSGIPVFMVPGIEGMAMVLAPLAKQMRSQTHCLQLSFDTEMQTIPQMAESMVTHIRSRLPPGSHFKLLGYSYGGVIALEIALALEKEGFTGNIVLIDSSPDLIQAFTNLTIADSGTDDMLQLNILCNMINILRPLAPEAMIKVRNDLLEKPTWPKRIDLMMEYVPNVEYSKKYREAIITNIFFRVKAMLTYKWSESNKVKSTVTLIRPSQMTANIEDDCGLSKCCLNPVEVLFVEGNHVTILDKKKCGTIINKVFSDAKKSPAAETGVIVGKPKMTHIG